MNVKKIVVKAGYRPLATLDEKGWSDPYGGTFAVEEIANLDRVLRGETSEVTIGRGTPYEVTHAVRMRVILSEGSGA